jgi:hypothetical protein
MTSQGTVDDPSSHIERWATNQGVIRVRALRRSNTPDRKIGSVRNLYVQAAMKNVSFGGYFNESKSCSFTEKN